MTKFYYTNINNIFNIDLFLNDVPAYRREKINRLKHERDKKASLCAGLLINKFFKNSEIKLGKYGKPFAGNGKFFNISHSGDYVIIAVSDSEVGCDIETVKDNDFERLGKIVFHENERNILKNTSDKKEYFYQLWTRKEAFIKCLGEGFHFKISSLDLSRLPDMFKYQGRTFFFKEYMLSDVKIMLCTEDNIFPEKIEEIIF